MKFLVLICLFGLAVAGPLKGLKPFHPMHKIGLDFQRSNTDGFIVGGVAVKSGETPYQVSLQRSSSHFCGGTIISSTWILTAAHCVSGLSASQLTIRYNSLNHASGGATIKAKRIIAHSGYDSYTLDNDIAVIELASAMTLGQTNAKAADLPAAGSDPSGNVLVSGWGYLKEGGGSLPAALQKVTVPVVSRDKCNTQYGGDITANMFCAGVDAGGKDACQGDSGGPVVVGNTVVGAVSWGYGCARPTHAGVYTRVSQYRAWLKTNTGL